MAEHRVLVLYSRLQPAIRECLTHFAEGGRARVLIFASPPNPNSPFSFEETRLVETRSNESIDVSGLLQAASKFQPTVVLVSGWTNSVYRSACRHLSKSGIPVVCLSDTQWKGTVRQRIAGLLAPFYMRPHYSHMWVPGARQMKLASQLGYNPPIASEGLLVADTNTFSTQLAAPTERRFIFVGELSYRKGIDLLLAAFAESKAKAEGWSLVLIGDGDLRPLAAETPGVEAPGFLNQDQLLDVASGGGVFVLPSRSEPWGVVVHEFALLGFPLVLSAAVGAGDRFLIDGWNGIQVNDDDAFSLGEALDSFASFTASKREAMGARSLELGKQVTKTNWAAQLSEVSSGGDFVRAVSDDEP